MPTNPAPYMCPITGQAECAERSCELHYMAAPINTGDPVKDAELTRDRELRAICADIERLVTGDPWRARTYLD